MIGKRGGYITTQGQILGELFEASGYKVTAVSAAINRGHRTFEILKTLATKRPLDIVILDTYSDSYFILADVVTLFCRLLRIPVILVLHGGNLPVFHRRYPKWVARVFKRSSALVAPSRFLASEFAKVGFDIRVIPNVVEVESSNFRVRTRISPNLLWMRSFHAIYHPEMALRVLAQLKEIIPAATLTMAGPDKGWKGKTQELAHELGIAGSVLFPGFLDKESKAEEMRKADIFINTNRIDNMPVSVIEARAFGLPVIATDVGGLRYVVTDGEDGFLVPDGDITAMVTKVTDLLSNPLLVQKVSENGYRQAKRSSWIVVKEQWKDLFNVVLRDPQSSSIGRQYFV